MAAGSGRARRRLTDLGALFLQVLLAHTGDDTARGRCEADEEARYADSGRPSLAGPARELAASGRWRAVAALAAGALPALAFPEPSLWWFAYVALVPWMLLVRDAPTGRRAAVEGWLGGMGFMIAVHHWLIPSLHVFIVLIAALLGLLWAPWGWLVWSLLSGRRPRPHESRRRSGGGALGLADDRTGQVVGGVGRSLGVAGGEPVAGLPALRLASVGGVWLVSLLVVTVNTAVTVLIAVPHARTAAVGGGVICALTTTAIWLWLPQPEPSGRARIAVVQPGVVDGIESVERRFARSEELTRQLAGQDIDLVVWGESSVGVDLRERPDLAARIAVLSRAVGADLLVNVDARSQDGDGRAGIFKSSVLVGPQGPTGDRYDKMRLVPFGEYIPARGLLGWATSVGKAAGEDRLRGSRPVVMVLPGEGTGGLRLGPLVCFESAFPDMSRRLTRDGAQLLIAQSATSSFQGSWAPEQHASLAALRAAEQ